MGINLYILSNFSGSVKKDRTYFIIRVVKNLQIAEKINFPLYRIAAFGYNESNYVN